MCEWIRVLVEQLPLVHIHVLCYGDVCLYVCRVLFGPGTPDYELSHNHVSLLFISSINSYVNIWTGCDQRCTWMKILCHCGCMYCLSLYKCVRWGGGVWVCMWNCQLSYDLCGGEECLCTCMFMHMRTFVLVLVCSCLATKVLLAICWLQDGDGSS